MTSNAATVSLSSLASGGCGPPGATPGAAVSTGSRCSVACSGANHIQRVASAVGAVECRSGEWVNSAGVGTGPAVCGPVCAAVVAPTADSTQCSQVVYNATWTAQATGTIADWMSTWRVHKAVSSAAMTLLEAEGRARMVSGAYLSLVGDRTLFAMNEPLWSSTPQSTQALTVGVDVQLGSTSAAAGVALRVATGVEPAAFYLLKVVNGPTGHALSKFASGVETVLLSVPSGLCTPSTSGWVRLVATVKAGVLSASCNGVPLGSVADPAPVPLFNGTVGLFHTGIPTVVTNPSNAASAVPAGTWSAFRNINITRDCDGPSGGCSASLPGERCVMGCPTLTTPAPGASTTLTCGASGTWSAAALVCLPSQTPSPTQSTSGTATATQTQSGTQNSSRSVTQTISQTQSQTLTQSASQTLSGTLTPSSSSSQTFTATSSPTPSISATRSQTMTVSVTMTSSQTVTCSLTATGSQAASGSSSSTPSSSISSTRTTTSSQATTSTASGTSSVTPSGSFTSTPSQTQSLSGTPSQTQSLSGVSTPTSSSTPTMTGSFTTSQVCTAYSRLRRTLIPLFVSHNSAVVVVDA